MKILEILFHEARSSATLPPSSPRQGLLVSIHLCCSPASVVTYRTHCCAAAAATLRHVRAQWPILGS
jgi:hypothetical protein